MTAARFEARPSLTARRVEVLSLVAEGLSNAEIAGRLGLTANTVTSHMRRIGARLGTGSRAGMVAVGFRTGLLRVPDDRPVTPQAGVPVPDELRAELLRMARMIVADRPLGELRAAARRAVALADGRVSR